MAISGRKPVHGDRVGVLVKFPPTLLSKVQAFADLQGMDRMAAIIRLMERGLPGGSANQVIVPDDPKPPPVTHVQEVPIPRRSRTAHVVSGQPAASGQKLQLGPTRPAAGALLKEAPKGERFTVQVGPVRWSPGSGLKK